MKGTSGRADPGQKKIRPGGTVDRRGGDLKKKIKGKGGRNSAFRGEPRKEKEKGSKIPLLQPAAANAIVGE